jgi:Mg2+ and Co2+ transporter CorA
MTAVLHGADSAASERVAAVRAQGRFFWLDVSLGETRLDDLAEALTISEAAVRAVRASRGGRSARTFHADAESVVFGLRCYAEANGPAGETDFPLRPVAVQVVITAGYLLTLHEERLSLPDALDVDIPDGRSNRYVVYSVLEAMIASSFDALEEVELRLDAMAVTTPRASPRSTAWTGRSTACSPRSTPPRTGSGCCSTSSSTSGPTW